MSIFFYKFTTMEQSNYVELYGKTLELQQENEQLKKENDQLRKLNNQLRKQLIFNL